MTNKITSKRIEGKWEHLLKLAEFSPQ